MTNHSHLRSLLGVPEQANLEQLNLAYQNLLQIWNPERFNGDPQIERLAHARINQLHHAYLTLVDAYTIASSQSNAASNKNKSASKLLANLAHAISTFSRSLNWHFCTLCEALWLLCSPRIVAVAVLVAGYFNPPHKLFLQQLGSNNQTLFSQPAAIDTSANSRATNLWLTPTESTRLVID